MKEMKKEKMKEEKEKKARENIYLRIEKCVLAYSVTSGASQCRDVSAFYLANHRDATQRGATWHSSERLFGTRVICTRIEQLND